MPWTYSMPSSLHVYLHNSFSNTFSSHSYFIQIHWSGLWTSQLKKKNIYLHYISISGLLNYKSGKPVATSYKVKFIWHPSYCFFLRICEIFKRPVYYNIQAQLRILTTIVLFVILFALSRSLLGKDFLWISHSSFVRIYQAYRNQNTKSKFI